MPSWLMAALEFIGPLTSAAEGVAHLAAAIIGEVGSSDSNTDKATKVAQDVADNAPAIVAAIVQNTPHAPPPAPAS